MFRGNILGFLISSSVAASLVPIFPSYALTYPREDSKISLRHQAHFEWAQEKGRISVPVVEQVIELNQSINQFGLKELDRLGKDEFNRRVDQGRVEIFLDGMGKARVTRVSGKYMFRVVPSLTGDSWIIGRGDLTEAQAPAEFLAIEADAETLLDEKQAVASDDGNLLRLESKQVLDASKGRGRNVFVVFTPQGLIENDTLSSDQVRIEKKPAPWSTDYVEHWWRGHARAPTLASSVFGVALSGGMQAATMATIPYVEDLILSHFFGIKTKEQSKKKVEYILMWALGIGIFNEFYKEVMNSGTPFSLNVKRGFQKVLFQAGYLFIAQPHSWVEFGVRFGVNMVLSNAASNASSEPARFRRDQRETTYTLGEWKPEADDPWLERMKASAAQLGSSVPFLGPKIIAKWKRSDLQLNATYQTYFAFKMASLDGFLQYHMLNLGDAALATFALVSKRLNVQIKEKEYRDLWNEILDDWNDLNRNERNVILDRERERRENFLETYRQWRYSKTLVGSIGEDGLRAGSLQLSLLKRWYGMRAWLMAREIQKIWQEQAMQREASQAEDVYRFSARLDDSHIIKPEIDRLKERYWVWKKKELSVDKALKELLEEGFEEKILDPILKEQKSAAQIRCSAFLQSDFQGLQNPLSRVQ